MKAPNILDTAWCIIQAANVGDGSTPGSYQPWLLEGGWSAATERYRAAYERGFRGVLVHRPFGEPDVGDVMDADAYVEAQNDPAAASIANDFADWTQRLIAEFPGTQVIAYIGSFQDADFRALANDPIRWLARALASIKALIPLPGVHIGFDHATSYDVGSLPYNFIRDVRTSLRLAGRLALFESLPNPSHNSDTDWPGYIVSENGWSDHVRALGQLATVTIPNRPIIRLWGGNEAARSKTNGWTLESYLADVQSNPNHIVCIEDRLIERADLRVHNRPHVVMNSAGE